MEAIGQKMGKEAEANMPESKGYWITEETARRGRTGDSSENSKYYKNQKRYKLRTGTEHTTSSTTSHTDTGCTHGS